MDNSVKEYQRFDNKTLEAIKIIADKYNIPVDVAKECILHQFRTIADKIRNSEVYETENIKWSFRLIAFGKISIYVTQYKRILNNLKKKKDNDKNKDLGREN